MRQNVPVRPGFTFFSVFLNWVSYFKPVNHPQFLSGRVCILMALNVLLRRYFTIHQCIILDETIQICLDKLYSLPGSALYCFIDTVRVNYKKKSLYF